MALGGCVGAGVTPGIELQLQRKNNNALAQKHANTDRSEDIRRQIPFVDRPVLDVKGGRRVAVPNTERFAESERVNSCDRGSHARDNPVGHGAAPDGSLNQAKI